VPAFRALCDGVSAARKARTSDETGIAHRFWEANPDRPFSADLDADPDATGPNDIRDLSDE
jgi:hypothetical protein